MEMGWSLCNLQGAPFWRLPRRKGQRSYLKLDDASALSTSNFEVSGSRIKQGLKGFIYGERGVWRPGNDIHLSFILEDKSGRIPEDHPVKMTLMDPRGNVKDEQVNTGGLYGLYTFKTGTSPDDPTGNWTARVQVGNHSFSKTIKVETIKPNRLKIDVELPRDIRYRDKTLTGQLNVKWLTGLTAPNLKSQIELSMRPISTGFDGFPNFVFNFPKTDFAFAPRQVYEGQGDENGQSAFSIALPQVKDAPGLVRATLDIKSYEPGGNFSIGTKSLTYYPYESFVGIRVPDTQDGSKYLDRKARHRFEFAAVDDQGKPISRKQRGSQNL